MAWWDINPEGDVIGDRPADIAAAALDRLATARERENGERPSLAGLLAGLGDVLSADAKRPVSIVAVTPSGEIRGDSPQARAEGAMLVPILTEMLARFTGTYEERWQRPPRPNEVAAATAFVLRPDPALYLRADDARSLDLDALRPEEAT
jgi:hypothetical protein